MLQISHLIGVDGKVFSKIAGLARGRRKVRSPADVCMCVLSCAECPVQFR